MNYNNNYQPGYMSSATYNPNFMSPMTYLQPQTPVLNGKFVESESIVKATEIPIGSYGVFPQADMSAIYLKQWANDGTTKIIPFYPKPEEPSDKETLTLSSIQKSINDLSKKIDSLNKPSPVSMTRSKKNGGEADE